MTSTTVPTDILAPDVIVLSRMTVQADTTTDRRRVFDFFLSPVVRYLDEGMKVR